MRVSQIRAHCLRTLRDCVLPLVEYTAVIERKCTTYSTSALFGPSTPDCLLIHITKYTRTSPSTGLTLFVHNHRRPREYIVSGPVMCMVWEGPGAVKACRLMIGETNPLVSNPGTIRGDLAVEVGRNVIHGGDSVESAEREIALWFGGAGELVDWVPANTPWVREA